MRKIITITISILMLINVARAQDSKYTASFLEMGIGARALAMGSAYVGLSSDASGFYWNPGGLAFLKNYQAASMYADLFGSLENQNYISVAIPIFGGATISLAWVRLSVEDIPRYAFDETSNAFQRITGSALPLDGDAEGSFSSYDDAYYITFAKYKRLNMNLGWQYFEVPIDFAYGANFKILRQQIDDKTGSGLGVDLGIQVRMALSDLFDDDLYGDLSFGLNAQDLTNTEITWDTDSKHRDEVERNFKYGFAYIQPLQFIKSRFTLAYDVNSKYEGSTHFGTELLYNSILAMRLGSNNGDFTTGAGIYFWKFQFDYAYQSHDLGNSHRVSVLLNF